MKRYGITFPVQPQAVDEVRKILSQYPTPQTRIGDDAALLATTVFMWNATVVRVIDVDGPLERIMAHLSADPAIRVTEASLNPYLVEPRALDRPDAAKAFFQRAMMRPVMHRETLAGLLPAGPAHDRVRVAVRYPVQAGRGAEVAELLSIAGALPVQADRRTALASTTVLHHGDLIVRFAEVVGDLQTAQQHLGRVVSQAPNAAQLTDLLEPGTDLTTPDGFQDFFRDHQLTVVADRRAKETVQ
jgi:hypothetical protein